MKYLTVAVKSVSDAGSGRFEAIASAPTLDRDGEVIAKGAFNPLPDTVPIHVDHRMSSEGLVGSARPFYSGDNLLVRGTFAGTARGQEVRQLVKEGHLNRMSVGFMDARKSKAPDGTTIITKAELLEVSFVTVSSNREAMVLAAKGTGRSMTPAACRRLAIKSMVEMALVDLDEVQRLDRKRGPRLDTALARSSARTATAVFLAELEMRRKP